eukprot:2231535-Rhodomonas_salina.1
MLDTLWNPKGYTLLYKMSKPIGPHYDVVQLDCVLGTGCQLMWLYSNVTGTIPEWVAGQQAKAFPYGRKSTVQVPGSPTY